MKRPAIKFLAVIFSLTIILSGCSSPSSGNSSPAPTATLTASPASFTAGQGSSVLTFSSTNAESGSINNGEGAVGLKGSVRVTPAVTTIYTYTATGPGGTATAQATVTVVPSGPAPTVTLKASPSAVIAGQAVTLSWTTSNASSIAISNLTDSSCSTPPCAVQPVASGSITVTPTTQTSYVATVTGDGQQVNSTPAVVTVNALTSFDGLAADPSNLGTQPQDADPNGAVGTKQFVEYINIEYQAYDKITHAPVWLTPQMIGTPWTNTINQGDDPNCDGHAGSGGSLTGIHLDGEIHFDRLAQRWVVMGKADFSNSYYLCLAVSNTDDLSSSTLGWYGYDFQLDSLVGSTSSNTNFPDWPKLGIWDDAYYVAFDIEIPPNLTLGGTNTGIGICAFDRNDILSQTTSSPQPVLGPVCVSPPVTVDPVSKGFLGHSLIPAEIDGLTGPPTVTPARPEYMVSIQNPDYSAAATTSNTINLWEAQVSWSGTPSLTITPSQLTVDTYTPGCYLYVTGNPTITNCVKEPQNGGQQLIDSVGDRLMPRFSYRNFGSHESYLVSHSIQTGPGASGTGPNDYQTGVRWYELRINSSGTPYIYQQNTINPDSALYRFLPSIAQDKDGNAVVGYSTSDISSNPGINFSYWNLGTQNATPTEVTILDGGGEELSPTTNGVGQWGSYAEITVDPFSASSPDCTFWYVNEYYAADSDFNWSTRISNFQVPGCQ